DVVDTRLGVVEASLVYGIGTSPRGTRPTTSHALRCALPQSGTCATVPASGRISTIHSRHPTQTLSRIRHANHCPFRHDAQLRQVHRDIPAHPLGYRP